jgi:nucleoside-diphosphate-sugar epimerase
VSWDDAQVRAGGTWEEMETVPKVALIVGVTGIVGNTLADQLAAGDAPGGPWKVYGLARRPKPDWLNQSNLIYIECNLLEREQTLAKLSLLHDVTHIFYLTWVSRDTEEELCEANGGMLHNVVAKCKTSAAYCAADWRKTLQSPVCIC